MGLVWVRVGAVVLVCAVAADARADKKKAGLFDIDWWKPPVKHEHDAAQTAGAARV